MGGYFHTYAVALLKNKGHYWRNWSGTFFALFPLFSFLFASKVDTAARPMQRQTGDSVSRQAGEEGSREGKRGGKRPRNLGAEGGVTPATDEEAVFQFRSFDPFF